MSACVRYEIFCDTRRCQGSLITARRSPHDAREVALSAGWRYDPNRGDTCPGCTRWELEQAGESSDV